MSRKVDFAIAAVAAAITERREALVRARVELDELLVAVDAESAEELIGVSTATREVLRGAWGWGRRVRGQAKNPMHDHGPSVLVRGEVLDAVRNEVPPPKQSHRLAMLAKELVFMAQDARHDAAPAELAVLDRELSKVRSDLERLDRQYEAAARKAGGR